MYSPAGVIATAVLLPLLGVFAVVLRFGIRLNSKPRLLGIDDWTILLACVLVCGLGALQTAGRESSYSTSSFPEQMID